MFPVFLALLLAAPPAQTATRSVHQAQATELGPQLEQWTEDRREAQRLMDEGRLFPAGEARSSTLAAPASDRPIVFGYLQSENQVFHTRWQALTHVGSRFVSFNSIGMLTGTPAFTGRSSYLKAGGAAQAAGTKVILVVNQFDDAPGGVIGSVMTSVDRRNRLASEIAALVASDGYVHGVSMDLEFSWGPQVRDGVTAFMASLRGALDLVDPALELSIYTNAVFSSNQWNFDAVDGITPSIDYMLYSMYDWATGSVPTAISDFNNCLGPLRMQGYLGQGLPPEKLVPVVSIYSRRWNGSTSYGVAGSAPSSSGFTDALFDVTLNPSFGGPYFNQFQAGDEAGWYTWNDGSQRIRTWEAPEALAVEFAHALSMQDPGGTWSGRRLGGIGFWSLLWMAETSSVDPRTGAAVSRTRTYPQVYQMAQELLGVPGQSKWLLETFSGLDFRWRDPAEAPDSVGDTDQDSSRTIVSAPAQMPAGSGNSMALQLDLEGPSGNRLVLAHEVLASPLAPLLADRNALLGHFDGSTELSVDLVLAAPLAGYSVRMLVVDERGQLEASQPYALNFSGLRTMRWDLGQGASGWSTLEPALGSGDGVLNSAGEGSADLGFFGFVFEGDGPLVGTLVLDNVAYRDVDPGGRDYRINELRYAGVDAEFMEIYGPSGSLPAGMELRTYDGVTGNVASSFPLVGLIPDDLSGRGFFVCGDASVPNVDSSLGFGFGSDDLPDASPSGFQLVDGSGHVYDSLVTEAFGGLGELPRPQTRGVTHRGQPWLGETASGTDALGTPYSSGRFPDGHDTRVNGADFSFQGASPGASNGNALSLPASFDFEGPLGAAIFQTFSAPELVDPSSAQLPISPSGGKVWRCVDPAGGGVIGVLGDAALGSVRGYKVQGEVYVPGPSEPSQAIALGVAGRQGSNFFSSVGANSSGYESGYWLIYENAAGVGLADGRADHPGRWELVFASHDNQDGQRVRLITAIDDLQAGVVPGSWTDFSMAVDPGAPNGLILRVTLGSSMIYADYPGDESDRRGSVQVGFRENHSGPPAAREGTWLDHLRVAPWQYRKTAQASGL